MPNPQKHVSASAAEARARYSPRLTNEDLAPTRQQNWTWYNIFSFWMSDVHSMGELAGADLPAGGDLHRAALR